MSTEVNLSGPSGLSAQIKGHQIHIVGFLMTITIFLSSFGLREIGILHQEIDIMRIKLEECHNEIAILIQLISSQI